MRHLFTCVITFIWIVATASATIHAGQARTGREPVYSSTQAARGQATFKEKCAACHGDQLEGLVGPPLSGDEFLKVWGNQPLSELVNKIQKTMPQNDPGSLTRADVIDVIAHILQVGKFPAGGVDLPATEESLAQVRLVPASAPTGALTPVASHAATLPPNANLAQVMRGIFFPSSNLIFNVQGHDPGEKKDDKPYEPSANDNFSWAQWGAGIYSPWEIVDYAALSIADAAPLLLVPGRRCENGRPVPVDQEDWNRFTLELIEAGKAAYKASQSRSQEAVSDVSNQLADACLHCHERYRDKPGGTTADPSNKVARCF